MRVNEFNTGKRPKLKRVLTVPVPSIHANTQIALHMGQGFSLRTNVIFVSLQDLLAAVLKL